jgi:hypothetical protein
MRPIRLFAALAVLSLVSAGCSPSSESAAPALASRPLTPAETEWVLQHGKQLAGEAFELLSSNLKNAIQQGGVSNALPYCSVAALPLTRSVAASQGAEVRRITHRPRNPAGKAEGVEMDVLKGFEQGLAGTNMPPPVVTNVTPGKVTFFAPIVLSQPLCLQCHGEPGTDILPEHVALIDKLYPQDQAKGFKLGQLRGAWRVDLPVQALDSRPRQ